MPHCQPLLLLATLPRDLELIRLKSSKTYFCDPRRKVKAGLEAELTLHSQLSRLHNWCWSPKCSNGTQDRKDILSALSRSTDIITQIGHAQDGARVAQLVHFQTNSK